ncbi:MAG TPA: hypothetical protein VGB91_05940 [Rhizomicrobium sp.]
MSRIVLGIGTSHSPLLMLSPQMWQVRAQDDLRNRKLTLSDGRVLAYDALLAETGGVHAGDATIGTFRTQLDGANRALDRLADELERARPDVVVIIGDDQDELFRLTHMPAIAVYYGAELTMLAKGAQAAEIPEWRRRALVGYKMDAAHAFPGCPEVALALIEGLMARDVDVAAASHVEDAGKAGFGHAYGFVVSRLFRGRSIPIVPVLLNTYFPPNVPSPSRCYAIGQAIGQTLKQMPKDLRIAVVASGGLSHFVTDAVLDRRVLTALAEGDAATLRALPAAALRSGSSEILNWVTAAGALEGLRNAWMEYLPVYRTPAGTGIGLAFTAWHGDQAASR